MECLENRLSEGRSYKAGYEVFTLSVGAVLTGARTYHGPAQTVESQIISARPCDHYYPRTPSQLETNNFDESPDHETELRPSIGGWREMSAERDAWNQHLVPSDRSCVTYGQPFCNVQTVQLSVLLKERCYSLLWVERTLIKDAHCLQWSILEQQTSGGRGRAGDRFAAVRHDPDSGSPSVDLSTNYFQPSASPSTRLIHSATLCSTSKNVCPVDKV